MSGKSQIPRPYHHYRTHLLPKAGRSRSAGLQCVRTLPQTEQRYQIALQLDPMEDIVRKYDERTVNLLDFEESERIA